MRTVPSLVELQGAFYERVMHGDTTILPWVVNRGLAATQRMQIYQHIVENTLSDALRTSYPAIALLVGDAFFDKSADQYMRRYPPQLGNLQTYGAHFSTFLTRMEAAASLPYLPDIARLEWARQQTYLAADAQTMDASCIAQRLQAFENDSVQLTLHPGVQLVISEHRIFDIWHYCMKHDSGPLHLEGNGQSILLWRDDVQVAMQVVDVPAAGFLRGVLHGMDIHDALSQQHTQGHPDFNLSELLPFLVANQMIVDIQSLDTETTI